MQEVLEKLDWHEKASQARYESISDKLKGYEMDKVENIFKTPMGGMMGDGIFGGMGGGGLLGGLILGSLVNRGGLWGGGVDNNANHLQASIDTNAILSGLSRVEATVPLAACQTQQQVVASANDTNSQLLQQTIGTLGAIANTNLLNSNGFAQVGDKIDAVGTANAIAFGAVNANVDRNSWQLAQVVTNDGDKTRALITAQYEATLNRQLSDANNEIAELRAEQRRQSDRHGIEITMTNNQNQNQLQFQAQSQMINQLVNGLVGVSGQIARATNSNLIVGNTGPTTTGPQNANPVNVNA